MIRLLTRRGVRAAAGAADAVGVVGRADPGVRAVGLAPGRVVDVVARTVEALDRERRAGIGGRRERDKGPAGDGECGCDRQGCPQPQWTTATVHGDLPKDVRGGIAG